MNLYKKRKTILHGSITQVSIWLKKGKIDTATTFFSLWWYEYAIITKDKTICYQYHISKETFIELVESFQCDQLTENVVKNMENPCSNPGPSLFEFLNDNWRKYNTKNPRTKQEYLPFTIREES